MLEPQKIKTSVYKTGNATQKEDKTKDPKSGETATFTTDETELDMEY